MQAALERRYCGNCGVCGYCGYFGSDARYPLSLKKELTQFFKCNERRKSPAWGGART